MLNEKRPVMQTTKSRRDLLAALSATGTAALIGAANSSAEDGGPETPTVRIAKIAGICIAPQYVADELLRSEGFSDVRYVATEAGLPATLSLTRGDVDFTANFASPLIIPIDAGEPITILAGEHIGCFELFANERIRSVADLKGKTVGVQSLGSSQHIYLSIIAAHVGLDPAKDIRWITSASPKPMDLFSEGKIDAFLGFPPEPQELRARNIGRVIVNSATDRPWSQYFCCMLAARQEYVRKHPVATKRVLRAILKAADLCGTQPEWVARRIVDAGFTPQYEHALRTLKEIPYVRWREYDPEDTIRFYALRLREAGMIKSNPNKIISEAANWRFVNELKRELKG
jgi:NitT/TauT family transport system substrate-binding protein